MIISSRVPPSRPARTILDYLSARFTYHPESKWREYILEGRIRCNDAECQPETLVSSGDLVSYSPAPFEEPAADLRIRIVYEDQWLAGVDKPGNLLVHRRGRSFKNNLMYQLRYCSGRDSLREAGLVNRLDRETSGVVLVAKTPDVLKGMHTLLRNGDIEKEYLALVHGIPPQGSMLIDEPIGRDKGSPMPCRHRIDRENGKESVTELRGVRPVGKGFSLLDIRPRTGRTHQIRVHLAWIGCPIVGDKLYGSPLQTDQVPTSVPETEYVAHDFPRQALHCCRMTFMHPVTSVPCTIQAPPAQDITELVSTIEPGSQPTDFQLGFSEKV